MVIEGKPPVGSPELKLGLGVDVPDKGTKASSVGAGTNKRRK
jgi:hypothetical protein